MNPISEKEIWEVRGLDGWFYSDEELALAKEVIDFLRPKGLPIYEVKAILDAAKEQLEQEPLAEKKACPEEQAD